MAQTTNIFLHLHSQTKRHLTKKLISKTSTALGSVGKSLLFIHPSAPDADQLLPTVNPQLHEMARQPRLDVPVSSHQARLGRGAVCVQHSLCLGSSCRTLLANWGPLWLCLSAQNNHWLQWFSGHESDSPESMWQLEDRKALIHLLFPLGTRTGVCNILLSPVRLEEPVLGLRD